MSTILSRIISGFNSLGFSGRSSRRNLKKKARLVESMNHYEELSFYYVLRETQKKPLKSPVDDRLGTRTRNTKRLIQCEECSKGFRYEKCLMKHRKVMHSLNQKKRDSGEFMRRDLLSRFIDVHKRKRSKRVSKYKKTTRFSVSVSSSSSSFTNFPVSEDDRELLDVAESLILLSKSGEAPVSNPQMNLREFEDGFLGNEQKDVGKFTDGSLSNEQKLVGIRTGSDRTSKSSQVKQVGARSYRKEVSLERVRLEDRPGQMLQNAKTHQKLGFQETAIGDSNSGNEGFQMNVKSRNAEKNQ